MRRSVVLLSAIAFLMILVTLLTTVSSLGQLYRAMPTLSPLLAQLIIVLIVLAMAAALGVLTYYAWLFLRPKRNRVVTLPEAPDQVAAVSLQAASQQVSQIEDEIARQALVARSEALAQRLQDQVFQMVVFGLGSAGKTALVNALLGEMAGTVAATLGTTAKAQTYRVALRNSRGDSRGDSRGQESEGAGEILITDTPGLLEAGVFGEARSQVAKGWAVAADLLLFVVDNDLHRVEYEPLAMLVGIGKRSLLVFNKCDRYLPEEKEQILQRCGNVQTACLRLKMLLRSRPSPPLSGSAMEPSFSPIQRFLI